MFDLTLNRRRFMSAATGAVCAGSIRRAVADTLPVPAGKVILTISGKIGVTNDDGVAKFDRDMLEALSNSSFTTMTPWYDTPVKFEGISLDRLMGIVGATGERLMAKALDDYTTDIPVSDFGAYHPLLAMKRNGEYLQRTDKGPLFIVYPYDSDPVLKHQRFYSRSAWQVARMIIS